jgi:hypothetical protein
MELTALAGTRLHLGGVNHMWANFLLNEINEKSQFLQPKYQEKGLSDYTN